MQLFQGYVSLIIEFRVVLRFCADCPVDFILTFPALGCSAFLFMLFPLFTAFVGVSSVVYACNVHTVAPVFVYPFQYIVWFLLFIGFAFV